MANYDGKVGLTGWRGRGSVVGTATISDVERRSWVGLFRHPSFSSMLGVGPATVTLLEHDRQGQTAPAELREEGLLVALRGLAPFS